MKEFEQSFYDAVYRKGGHKQEYFKDPEKCIYFPMWKEVIGLLSDQDKIIDVGCGPGQLAELIIKSGFNYVAGFDFSSVAIGMAKKRNPAHSFFVADVNKSNSYPGYNTVVLCEVLEHINEDLHLLNKFRLGSKIIFSVPSFNSASHVRFFNNADQVADRYSEAVTINEIKTFPVSSNKSIFLINSTKK